VGQLLEELPAVYQRSRLVWFRGHFDAAWKLEPTLARRGKLPQETLLIKQFQQNAVQFLERPVREEADWIFLMQHYGVPTRLLDWTESPLMGLYFALDEPRNFKGRKPAAAMWCLFPQKLNRFSNLVLKTEEDIPAFGVEDELKDYLPSRVREGVSHRNPVAIIAPRTFSRVYAQQGVFTICHKDNVRIDDLADDDGEPSHLIKFIIPRRAVSRIRKELLYLGVHKLSVFPQLENVAARIVEAM
jgi:hypothetical protein